jgi:tRNA-specific 2-thiouridylase
MEKILIAVSGGVDSAVAALLLKERGYACQAAMMELFHRPEGDGIPHSPDGAAGVSALRARMERDGGMPFHLFDCAEDFREHVIAPFITAYRAGRTPNPCVACNRTMKFGVFLRRALELGFDGIATGHYARVERDGGRFLLKKGIDPQKDQSYMLYALSQKQLGKVLFPLGGLRKEQVREIAREAGLDAAERKESQDICFIPDGGHAGYIERSTGKPLSKGPFVGPGGQVLGQHEGIGRYTVGQRRGLGVSAPEPLYVKEIRAGDNTVVLGPERSLYCKTFVMQDVNLIALDRVDAPLRAAVKIRYRHAEQPAAVTQLDDGSLRVDFDEPQRAVTPGQAAVIYSGEAVIGGGTIRFSTPFV